MRKKILLSMVGILLFSFVIITTFLLLIVNYQYEENIKYNLKMSNQTINKLLIHSNLNEKEIFSKNNFNDPAIRITYIDKTGKVLQDSSIEADTLDNHNTRKEVIEARQKGVGTSIRFSDSTKKNMMYYATVFKDGNIIRSSMPMEVISGLEWKTIKYYIIAITFVFSLAMFIAFRLSNVLVKPIEDLEFITSKVAYGELDRRVKCFSKDEIGRLGKTFNNMADRLQNTVEEAMDKQNRLEAILKSMDSGVIAVDRNYRVIMINPYAKKIFGVDKDIIGHNLMDYIRNFELEDILKNNKETYQEIKIIWPKERELRIRTADIINESGYIGTVAVVQDITDVKKLENMRSQFLANASHELKTPLTSIKGFAETLKYVEDSETKDKFLDIINDEAERLTRLINDILILADIESNKDIKNEIVKFDINEAIKDVYNLMKNTADNKEINLSIEQEAMASIIGSKDRFKQMLINLVDNAIKYSDQKSRIVIGTKTEGDYAIIWVEDSGFGIPRSHIPRLFERFYRVDKARSRAVGGTGLGLAIVKHIVLNFDGTIEVKSEIGKGSKFTIKLPYIKV
jgi:two-component system, OmpR family, phosphate regulon sensor histidine kinase PhoR